MQFEPCGHRVLITPDVVEEKTAGGIILAQTTKDRDQQATMRGTVAAIGINAWKAFDGGEPWAAVGDRVVFRRYAGEVIKEGDKEYRIVNDEDILSVIRAVEVINLGAEAVEIVAGLIADPPEPNEALKSAMQKRREG